MMIFLINCSVEKESTSNQVVSVKRTQVEEDSLVAKYLERGAWTKGLFSSEWQAEIDKGIAVDSTFAYFWQQKSMPLFKQGKYELGMPFLDKAVKFKREEYLEYRGFMKCIFAKQYSSAIEDFEACKREFGNSIVMDHSYNFYIAISLLQLNEFEKAETILLEDIAFFREKVGESFIDYLDLFYLGIAQYEQKKFDAALKTFDKCLEKYSRFAEGLYYKGLCMRRLDKDDETYKEWIEKAVKSGKAGNTIVETNSVYERYPYQMISWE